MRVRSLVLVNPPVDPGSSRSGNLGCFPPLGLHSLATAVAARESGLELDAIRVVDAEVLGSVSSVAGHLDADVVGISVLAANYRNAIRLAREAKRRGAVVVLGNDYASAMCRPILERRPEVDYIVLGDATEERFCALLRALGGNQPVGLIPGLAFRSSVGSVCVTEPPPVSRPPAIVSRRFVEHPQVYFDNYLRRYGHLHHDPVRCTSTCYAQGCNWGADVTRRCIYCDIPDLCLRALPPRAVWDNVKELQETQGVTWIYEVCDSFSGLCVRDSSGRSFVDDLIAVRPAELDMAWFVYARASDISPTTVSQMAALGVRRVNIGFDAGCSRALSALSKGVSQDVNERAVELLVAAGIQIYCSFVLGSPGEDGASLEATVCFAERMVRVAGHLMGAIMVSPLLPLPGSRAWARLQGSCGRGRTVQSSGRFVDLEDDSIDLYLLCSLWAQEFCSASIEDIVRAAGTIERSAREAGVVTGGFGVPEQDRGGSLVREAE